MEVEGTHCGFKKSYLTDLPQTARKISKLFNKKIVNDVWFDLKSERIIKKNTIRKNKQEYPYIYIRSSEVLIKYENEEIYENTKKIIEIMRGIKIDGIVRFMMRKYFS